MGNGRGHFQRAGNACAKTPHGVEAVHRGERTWMPEEFPSASAVGAAFEAVGYERVSNGLLTPGFMALLPSVDSPSPGPCSPRTASQTRQAPSSKRS